MAYLRIKEAAEKIGVQPHVLRFWESQIPALRPPKTSRGQRLYSEEDVQNFLKVKHLLYTEGYSISGAKRALKGQEPKVNSAVHAAVELEVVRDLLKELKELRDQVKEF